MQNNKKENVSSTELYQLLSHSCWKGDGKPMNEKRKIGVTLNIFAVTTSDIESNTLSAITNLLNKADAELYSVIIDKCANTNILTALKITRKTKFNEPITATFQTLSKIHPIDSQLIKYVCNVEQKILRELKSQLDKKSYLKYTDTNARIEALAKMKLTTSEKEEEETQAISKRRRTEAKFDYSSLVPPEDIKNCKFILEKVSETLNDVKTGFVNLQICLRLAAIIKERGRSVEFERLHYDENEKTLVKTLTSEIMNRLREHSAILSSLTESPTFKSLEKTYRLCVELKNNFDDEISAFSEITFSHEEIVKRKPSTLISPTLRSLFLQNKNTQEMKNVAPPIVTTETLEMAVESESTESKDDNKVFNI